MLLTLLALAAPLPAFAISDESIGPITATPGPSAITVAASLDSCGVIGDGVVCKLDVSFNEISGADTYTATVTRADGSVIDYGGVGPGGTSIWVPYVGAGSYSVKITAYGEPEASEGRKKEPKVIATGETRSLRPDRNDRRRVEPKDVPSQVQADPTLRDPAAPGNASPDGVASAEASPSAAAAAESAACPATQAAPAPPVPPQEPPEDLDPNNPDEDLDGVPDEVEVATYEQQLAEYEAALAAAAQAPPAPEGC